MFQPMIRTCDVADGMTLQFGRKNDDTGNMADKPADLEFIDVEAGAGAGPTAAATNVNIPAKSGGTRSKAEDAEALLTSMHRTVTNAKHPVAAFFHVLFKVLAIFLYMFGSILFDSYVFIFVLCILLLAFDFWTVKNVSGRLLVGLRWWNQINEDGTNEWIFESHEDMTEIDPLDSRVFWVGLYATPAIWGFFFIIAVLKFNVQWALIVVVALTLSSANIIGYTKCKKDARQKMHSLMSQGALGALSTSAGSSLMSTISGFAMSAATSSKVPPSQTVTV